MRCTWCDREHSTLFLGGRCSPKCATEEDRTIGPRQPIISPALVTQSAASCGGVLLFLVRMVAAVGVAVVAAGVVSSTRGLRGAPPFSTGGDMLVMLFAFVAFMYVSRRRASRVKQPHGRTTA